VYDISIIDNTAQTGTIAACLRRLQIPQGDSWK
jgi:hypothetical protein